jgi:hypothetical protein
MLVGCAVLCVMAALGTPACAAAVVMEGGTAVGPGESPPAAEVESAGEPAAVTAAERIAAEAAAPSTITRIDLRGPWKFNIDLLENGVVEGWHQPDFDDTAWRSLHVPSSWEKQGIATSNPRWPPDEPVCLYNGYAWYRRHVTIPADWNGARVLLRMGQVWDLDWTYVNGELVGTTQGEDAWEREREYLLPPDVLNAGGDNLIAVRVCDYRMEGGIAVGPVELVNTTAAGTDEPGVYLTHRDDMVNIGGSVEVPADTRVDGDVVAVGGGAEVRGRVTGDVVAVGGSVHLYPEGRVDGDIVIVGGRLIRDPGSRIGGQVNEVSGIPGDVVERIVEHTVGAGKYGPTFGWLPLPVIGVLGAGFSFFTRLVFWGVFALVVVLVMPKRLELMAQSLPIYPGRAAVYGLAGVALSPPSLLVVMLAAAVTVVLLAITVIGILLIPAVLIAVPALLAALVLAVLVGVTAVWLGIGRAVIARLGRPDAAAIWAALLGVALVGVISLIPALGALVWLTLLIFGFGVALMTGIGTDPEWAHRRLGLGRGPETPPAASPPPPVPPTPAEPAGTSGNASATLISSDAIGADEAEGEPDSDPTGKEDASDG